MEKVIIDIGLLNQWSGLRSPENSKEITKPILLLLAENNFQPYIFDFQAKQFRLKVLKSQFKGIRIKIIEKEAYSNSLSLALNYEEQFKVKLNDIEKISFLSYAGCGFTGMRYFLRKHIYPPVIDENSGISNKFLTFNLELVKI